MSSIMASQGVVMNCCLGALLFGEDGTPNIRPLETLHNALSLRQVDDFLEQITNANYKTPNLSPKTDTPPENPSMLQ
jgi:inositol hexakisphosphate/diphosphoinositol-pentakisphosphate kinase